MKDRFQRYTAAIALRWGLAFVFFYAAVSALLDARNWVGYFPHFVISMFGAYQYVLISIFALFEVALAAWLFWGRNIRFAAGIAFLVLAGITMANYASMDIFFRDVGLALAALALYVLAREDRQPPGQITFP